MNQTTKQLSFDDEPIGTYGTQWQEWMQNHHKKLVREMHRKGTFEAVARSVDERAWNYRELLDRQYEEMHTRPLTFEEIVSWERTREYYTDSTVMRDKVLVPVTKP